MLSPLSGAAAIPTESQVEGAEEQGVEAAAVGFGFRASAVKLKGDAVVSFCGPPNAGGIADGAAVAKGAIVGAALAFEASFDTGKAVGAASRFPAAPRRERGESRTSVAMARAEELCAAGGDAR